MLIDTHAHINDERLDSAKIIAEMQKNNLEIIINVSYDLKSMIQTWELAEANEKVYAVVGIHPSEAQDFDNSCIEAIKKFSTSKKVVAIGEIGLDYHYENTDKENQKKVLISQLKLADELNLPVVIHLRDAFLDFENLIIENKKYINNGMLMHCYNGSFEFAKMLMKNIENVYFSFGGALTFKNAKNIEQAFFSMPLNRILSETDCPYLTPEPFRGQKLNEPALVERIVEKMADIKQMSLSNMSEIILDNAYTFFKEIKK